VLLVKVFCYKLNDVVGMARANSLWPLPLQLVAELNLWLQWHHHYDLARFGSERVSFSPRQADMLMVMGTISKKWRLFYVKYMSKWQSLNGLLLLELVLLQVEYFDTYSGLTRN
jgi:NADH-quinone oxidoreductase subunit B